MFYICMLVRVVLLCIPNLSTIIIAVMITETKKNLLYITPFSLYIRKKDKE